MRKSLLLLASLLLVAVIGLSCQLSPNHYDTLQLQTLQQLRKQPASAPEPAQDQPLLGIAFGGGGVRGFMHLGVIKALEQAAIKAPLVVGSSAGAIAAALYASGLSYARIEAAVLALSERQLADPVLSRQGFVNGQALAAWINSVVGGAPIEALPVRAAFTATDLQRGQAMLITAGNVGQAVQASSSIPGVFVPIQSNRHTLTDGGALALIPVAFTRALGAEVVLAVDVYCGADQPIEHNMINTLLAVFRLQSCELSAAEAAGADLLISPDFEPQSFRNFDSREAAIAAGYEAAMAVMPQLRALLQR